MSEPRNEPTAGDVLNYLISWDGLIYLISAAFVFGVVLLILGTVFPGSISDTGMTISLWAVAPLTIILALLALFFVIWCAIGILASIPLWGWVVIVLLVLIFR